MVVLCHRKAITTFQAPALEDLAAPLAGHPGAETMHARTAANFWLVSSLWHIDNLSLDKIIIQLLSHNVQTNLYYTQTK